MLNARLILMVVLSGCADTHKERSEGSTPSEDRGTSGTDFHNDDTVKITSPIEGDTLESPFTLTYEAGISVSEVSLQGPDLETFDTPADGVGTIEIDGLDQGHTNLLLTGLAADGTQLDAHSISVRIIEMEEEGPWVTITSPTDGAEPINPVVFAVAASDEVESIELFADDWSLGTVDPGEILTYTFEGTGFVRTIDAVGYADAIPIATDTIQLTVQEADEPPIDSDMTSIIWDIAQTYPTDGTHDYYWPSDGGGWAGTTQDIWYLDELVAEGDPYGRCYCVGLTWEVYMQAFDQMDEETGGDGSLNSMTVSDLYSFRTDFYVRELMGAGVVDAFDNYGIGEEVTNWEDAKPGDFLQIWRYSGSGHSVIFHSWDRDLDDSIVGVNYWSTQSSTDGIGVNTEYFGSGDSDINPTYFFIARPWSPIDWLPW